MKHAREIIVLAILVVLMLLIAIALTISAYFAAGASHSAVAFGRLAYEGDQ